MGQDQKDIQHLTGGRRSGKEIDGNQLLGVVMEQKLIAPRAPWQDSMVERLIGSIRRECLDHVIVLNDNHLRLILTD
jgi:hypothetical protein